MPLLRLVMSSIRGFASKPSATRAALRRSRTGCTRASLAVILGACLVTFGSASAGVLVVSHDPEYVAAIADRLVGRKAVSGGQFGQLAGQRIAVPDVEMPLEAVLGRLQALAGETACSTVVAIMPGRAASDATLEGDIVLAARVLGAEGSAPLDAERDLIDAIRLAGADAGFFEVPDPRAGATGGRAPRVLVGKIASSGGAAASGEAGNVVGNWEASVVSPGTYPVARSLDASGLRWAIVAPVIGRAGEAVSAAQAERAVGNVSRLILSYVKAIPPQAKPSAMDEPFRRIGKGMISLREAPHPSAAVTATFRRGGRYQVLESTPDESWNRIQLLDGSSGWVMGSTLEREPLVVYALETRGGFEVLTPREYDVSTQDANAAFVARAVCSPNDARLAQPRGHEAVPFCAGIDSFELVVDTVNVFLGQKSKAFFSGANSAESDRFLARLVYSLTEIERIRVVRLRFTIPDPPFVPRLLTRDDFVVYWPTLDLERMAQGHPSAAMQQRAKNLLEDRRRQ